MPVKVGLQYIDKWKESMEEEVRAYEAQPQEPGQIVFYGSSSFTRWGPKYGMRPLREDLRGASGAACVVNRGFGSSCSEHQLYYYPRMIRPLAPRALVYTALGNGRAFGYTLEEIWELAQRVVAYAQTDFPGIHVYLCGGMYHKRDKAEDFEIARRWDALLQEFCAKNPDCRYLNFLDYEPLCQNDLFVADDGHYNQKGYDRFGDYFREALKEELAQY